MKTLLGLLLALAFVPVIAGQEMLYHDPALDTLNNNIGYLDADINGNFQYQNMLLLTNVPDRIANALFTNAISQTGPSGWLGTNVSGAVNSLGLGSISANTSVGFGTKTNAGAATNAVGALFSQMATNGLGEPLGLALGGSTTEKIFDLTSFPTQGVAITFQFPKLNIHNPLGSTTSETFMFGTLGGNYETIATSSRWIILASACVMYFFMFVSDIKENMGQLIGQRQMVGTPEAVLGTNASLPSSMMYSCLVTAFIISLCGVVLQAGVISAITNFATLGSFRDTAITFFHSIPAWDAFTLFVPLMNIILLHIFYMVARHILIGPVFLSIRMIILWLPA